jgi:hypothetical protein
MRTAKIRFLAGLACFALPLGTSKADDSPSQHLPRFVFQPPAADAPAPKPPQGTPYASLAVTNEPAVKMTTVEVKDPQYLVFDGVRDAFAQAQRLESCALVKESLPGNRSLEAFLAPEPPANSSRKVPSYAASFPLLRFRW